MKTIACLFCGDPVEIHRNGATCTDCNVYGYPQDNERWMIYLPLNLVPTSDWVDCPACEGSGWIDCDVVWCGDPDHGGPCGNCRALGVVRGTLDHPTTHPPQETL